MGSFSRQFLFRYLSKKEYLLETISYLFFSWLWAHERFAVPRSGHMSISRYIEFGLFALCLLKWLIDTFQRSVRVGMSRLGGAAFSIVAATAWVSSLVVKMNQNTMLGVIAVIVFGQLLLVALPEAAVVGGSAGGAP